MSLLEIPGRSTKPEKELRRLVSESYDTARVVGRGTVKIDLSEVSGTEAFKQAIKRARSIVKAAQATA